MLSRRASYEEIYASFRWNIPEYYNIAVDVCDKWAVGDPSRVALINIEPADEAEVVTYDELRLRSNRLANLLRSAGVSRGSRVAILLPQCADTAIAHIATYKLGGIVVPLSILFGPDALEYRLKDAGVEALITTSMSYAKLASREVTLPDLKKVCLIDQRNFQAELGACSPQLEAVRTRAEDPALIIYTSGTTGMPKGAYTLTECSSDICLALKSVMISFLRPVIAFGRRQIGPGSEGCWMFSSPPCITEFQSSHIVSRSSPVRKHFA